MEGDMKKKIIQKMLKDLKEELKMNPVLWSTLDKHRRLPIDPFLEGFNITGIKKPKKGF